MNKRVLILGCGPAAAICAVELKRLGFGVQVVGKLRAYPVLEGLSERVFHALSLRGIAKEVSEPVPRTAIWNGETRIANTERLVYRPDFDQALMSGLKEQGLAVHHAHIADVDTKGRHIRTLDGQEFSADFLVDARGRAAGFEGKRRQRGPEAVSLACRWQSEQGSPMTLAVSLPSGWMWLARNNNGVLFAQLTRGGEPLDIRKDDIPDVIAAEIVTLPMEIPLLKATQEERLARSSTAILVDDIVEPGYIRIGDAASAVDPLSGNGIFQSLSSALTAVPVINTMVSRPTDAPMAMQFYRDRVKHLFLRFARIGRDFYRSESSWPDNAFWQTRQNWPDNLPSHVEVEEVIGKALKPVINGGFIEQKEVIITRDQPMGVWQVNGKEILS